MPHTSPSGLRYSTFLVTVGDADQQETQAEIRDSITAGVRSRGFMTVDVQPAAAGDDLEGQR